MGNTISAMFLVGGTCIGGGILMLPITSGISGFVPSLVMMSLCWFAMTASALLLLEASLWMEEGAHIITMTSQLLGKTAKIVSWLLYLYVCYASLVAYTAGGGLQVAEMIHVSKDVGCLLFIVLFGAVLYLGARLLGVVNTVLFVGLIGAYFALVGAGLGEVKSPLLVRSEWSASLMSLPILLTAFSFQTMVPSLTPYLKRDVRALRIAIVGGTLIAFAIYAIWQWVMLGIVPLEGENGLIEALNRGDLPATHFIRAHVDGRWIGTIADFFAFFAIVTSFLGIGLGLFDFLSDGLKIKKKGMGKIWLALLIILPTLFFSTQFERAFSVALESTGGFGDTILNGIFPVLMVWVGRYKLGYSNAFRLPGGKGLLIFIGLFFFLILTLECLAVFGGIRSVYHPLGASD